MSFPALMRFARGSLGPGFGVEIKLVAGIEALFLRAAVVAGLTDEPVFAWAPSGPLGSDLDSFRSGNACWIDGLAKAAALGYPMP